MEIGFAYDPLFVNGTSCDYYEFYIELNRCGSKISTAPQTADGKFAISIFASAVRASVYVRLFWLCTFVTGVVWPSGRPFRGRTLTDRGNDGRGIDNETRGPISRMERDPRV